MSSGHLAVPHCQHTDQRRTLRLLRDNETGLGVRDYHSAVFVPVDVEWGISQPRRVADELDRTSTRHILAARHLDSCSYTQSARNTM